MSAKPEKIAADHIRELTQGHTTSERVLAPVMRPVPTVGEETKMNPWWEAWRLEWRQHTVTHPALLDQLDVALQTNTAAGGDTVRPAPGSRPAGRLHVLTFLARVEHQSADLAKDHDLPVLPIRDRLVQLAGQLGDKPHPMVKSWWVTARILTCHDSPPFTPNVPCPNEHCDRRGTLRVRVEEHPDDRVATCVECGMVWAGTADFGMLARWVEWAADHLDGPQHVIDGQQCAECLPWRDGMADREAARLAKSA